MSIEEFTYSAYADFLKMIHENGYRFSSYHDSYNKRKVCIIRHDVDSRLEKALLFGEIEYKSKISSTYFVLLRTDMYNVFSKRCVEIIKRIQSLGHEIGLHYDEKYNDSKESDTEEIIQAIKQEAEILSNVINHEIKVVSMHRPSTLTLERDYRFDDIENSNSKGFIEGFKYLSDSRMYWRENVEEAILSGQYEKLHISLHPEWYSEEGDTLYDNLLDFVDSAKKERYQYLSENIYDFEAILCKEETR